MENPLPLQEQDGYIPNTFWERPSVQEYPGICFLAGKQSPSWEGLSCANEFTKN